MRILLAALVLLALMFSLGVWAGNVTHQGHGQVPPSSIFTPELPPNPRPMGPRPAPPARRIECAPPAFSDMCS
jgi:hypothetical protein